MAAALLSRILLWVILVNFSTFTSVVKANNGLDTYTDDEDLTPYSDFSGSGDSQSQEEAIPKQSVINLEGNNIDQSGKNEGKIINLSIPKIGGIELQDKTRTDHNIGSKVWTLGAKPVKEETNSIEISKEELPKAKDKKLKSVKKSKSESQKLIKKVRKKKKDKHQKATEKKNLKKPKKPIKAFDLNLKAKSTVTLSKKGNNFRKNDNKNNNFHIRRNIDMNRHQDRPIKRKHRHNHHKKRWRKNIDSNRHGYGKKGVYKKKKPTFEDRWPGCFAKYQSCYRDNNCCNKHCQQFKWLSFGFCL